LGGEVASALTDLHPALTLATPSAPGMKGLKLGSPVELWIWSGSGARSAVPLARWLRREGLIRKRLESGPSNQEITEAIFV
jgi:hypothetical protein